MGVFDKKTLIVLAIFALSSGALAVDSVQTDANKPVLKDAAPIREQTSTETDAKTNSLFANDPGFQKESPYSLDRQELFYRTMVAIVFVIALGAAAIYVSKRLLPKIARLPGKEIRIVETVHLGPRKAVHLLQIGHRRFLIGSANESVTKLADLSEGFGDLPEDIG